MGVYHKIRLVFNVCQPRGERAGWGGDHGVCGRGRQERKLLDGVEVGAQCGVFYLPSGLVGK